MVEFSSTEVQLPFQSTRDLENEAAKQFTYALVNPQLAGPFTQVGDDQLAALKKLAAFFEGALPTHKQRTATPLLNNTIKSPHMVDITDSPQRVDTTESPHKEHMPASSPRVVVPTASNQMTPNSHRRQQTTPHRFVTPITPHHMTRKSAGMP
jgi:hypothetical protein